MAIHDLSAPARRLIAVSMFAFLPVPASPQADPIPDCSEMLHFDYLEESFLGSPGGPFSPHRYTSTFTNPGPYETWFDVTEIPEWLEVRWDCGTSDGCTLPTTLDPGESVDVWFRLTDVTEGYPVGEYSVELMPSWGWPCSCDGTCPYECTGCAIIAPGILDFTLEVVECAGITAKLLPEITITPTSMILENEERGVYITMLHDLELCGLGILLEPSVPQTIRAAVYDATGSSRGALLADGFFTAQHGGENIYYVPVSLTLEGTEEYEISFTYAGANGPVSVWSESGVGAPFDKSFVRVRDADRYCDPAT